jgi:hypothetical protein
MQSSPDFLMRKGILVMTDRERTAPFPAGPTRLLYPDVDPDELAREQAVEPQEVTSSWPDYLSRVLGAAGAPPAGDG